MREMAFSYRRFGVTSALLLVLGLSLLFHGVGHSQEPVQLTFGYKGQPAEVEIGRRMFEKFLEMHPNVEGTIIDLTAGGSWWEKLQTLMATGLAPDVTRMEYMVSIPIAMQGGLRPIDEFIARDSTFDLSDFHPGAIAPHQWDGKLWGIPKEAVTMVMFYNRDLFDRYGAQYPTQSWTIDEFLEVARLLTQDRNGDMAPDTWGYDFMWGYTEWLVMSHNGGFHDFDPETGEFTLDRPGAIQALQLIQDMRHEMKVAPPPGLTGFGFPLGNVGMTYQGPWMVPDWRTLDFDWSIAEVPIVNGERYTVIGFDAYSMSAQTEQPDLAWELIKFMSSAEIQEEEARLGGVIPSRRSALLAGGWWDPSERPYTIDPYIRSLDFARPMAVAQGAAYASDVSQYISAAMDRIMRNEVSAAIAIAEVADAIRQAAIR